MPTLLYVLFVTGKFTEPPHCTAEHTQDASAFCLAYDVTATGLNIKMLYRCRW